MVFTLKAWNFLRILRPMQWHARQSLWWDHRRFHCWCRWLLLLLCKCPTGCALLRLCSPCCLIERCKHLQIASTLHWRQECSQLLAPYQTFRELQSFRVYREFKMSRVRAAGVVVFSRFFFQMYTSCNWISQQRPYDTTISHRQVAKWPRFAAKTAWRRYSHHLRDVECQRSHANAIGGHGQSQGLGWILYQGFLVLDQTLQVYSSGDSSYYIHDESSFSGFWAQREDWSWVTAGFEWQNILSHGKKVSPDSIKQFSVKGTELYGPKLW